MVSSLFYPLQTFFDAFDSIILDFMAPTATVTSPSIPNPADLKAAMKAANETAVAPVDSTTTEAVEAAPAVEPAFDSTTLFTADKASNASALTAFIATVQKDGPSAFTKSSFTTAFKTAIVDKKSPATREAAANVLLSLAKDASVNKSFEVYFVQEGLLSVLIEAFADKMPAIRTVAANAAKEFAKNMNPWAVQLILPTVLEQIKTAGKWQIKTGSLEVLNQMIASAPIPVARSMPDIIPVLSEVIWDTKADVKKASRDTLTKACALISNKDIEKFIPALISCLINPVEEVPSTVGLLSATTFVSEVDSATLSLMVPLLSRGLTEKLTSIKRKVAVYVCSSLYSFHIHLCLI